MPLQSTATIGAIAEPHQQPYRKRNHTTSSRHRKLSVMKRSVLATTMALALGLNNHQGHAVQVVDAAMNPSAIAALKALKSVDYRYFVAGGTCAAFSHGITTPIDVVKTKLQANPEKYKGKGLIGATVQICRDPDEGGPAALLSGLGPTVLGYGVEGAMKFGAYEVAKPIFGALLGGGDGSSNKVLSFVLASILAGAIASILLVPMESLRIKQVTDPSYQQMTVFDGLPKIFRDDGFWITMSGIYAMLTKQVPYTFGKQVSFDLVAKFLYSINADASLLSDDQAKWIVSLLSAFCASIVACLCSQPGDMVLTETYNKGSSSGAKSKSKSSKRTNAKASSSSSSSTTPGSFGKVVGEIYARGGVPEFYRGTPARLVHVGMIITSQLVIYDMVKQFLGLPATGSH